MKVYVFGNWDLEFDNNALKITEKLSKDLDSLEFIEIKPNQDISFEDEDNVVILDVIEGLKDVRVFDEKHIDRLVLSPRNSVHDFDLGFQLKYLKKLGKIKNVKIVGLPMTGDVDYNSIHSIFKKLVAQDIQGS
jgi:Ni,Fe-hydrogenase maturation factor